MAVFQVLAHFMAYVARGLQLTRNPGRVIGFHLLSITPGADIGPKASRAARRYRLGTNGRGPAGEGRALVVCGEPGVGKTMPLDGGGRAGIRRRACTSTLSVCTLHKAHRAKTLSALRAWTGPVCPGPVPARAAAAAAAGERSLIPRRAGGPRQRRPSGQAGP